MQDSALSVFVIIVFQSKKLNGEGGNKSRGFFFFSGTLKASYSSGYSSSSSFLAFSFLGYSFLGYSLGLSYFLAYSYFLGAAV